MDRIKGNLVDVFSFSVTHVFYILLFSAMILVRMKQEFTISSVTGYK